MKNSSWEEQWEKEIFTLKIGDLYQEPCLFLVKSFHTNLKDRKNLAWFLLFIFLWFRKGNLTLPLHYWEKWIEEILSERTNALFSENPSEEIKKDFLPLLKNLKEEIKPLESLKKTLERNPSFISYQKEETPLWWGENKEYISFSKFKDQEDSFLSSFLSFLKRPQASFFYQKEKIPAFEKSLKNFLGEYPLTEEQSSLLNKTLDNSFIILSGGPGTGKTTTILSLLRGLISLRESPQNCRIALCAPTGLAAMRLKESIETAQRNPFFFEGENIDNYLKLEPKILDSLLGLGYRNPPRYNKKNPLPFDILLVDEASMIDLSKFQNLIEALSWRAKLILVGDPYQLPPINTGAPFKDIEKLAKEKNSPLANSLVHLTQNFRFAKEPFLQEIITLILEGKGKEFLKAIKESPSPHFNYREEENLYNIIPSLYLDFWINERIKNKPFKLSDLEEKSDLYLGRKELTSPREKEKLLSPLKKTVLLTSQNEGIWGSKNINELMKEEHKKYLSEENKRRGKWLLGVPLMVTCNRPDLKVVNGERGIIFYPKEEKTPYACFFKEEEWISFPLSDLKEDYSLSFCQTIHKSQGSEYERVFVILKQNSSLLSQELLYTALTRTKKYLTLISQEDIILKSCFHSNLRDSLLSQNLKKHWEKKES